MDSSNAMRCTWPAWNDLRVPPTSGTRLIGRFGSGLPRIVVADVDGLALDLPAVDFEHLVLQDGRVVVKFSLEDRPLGDLDEFRRDLDAAPLRELGIRAWRTPDFAFGAADGHREQGNQKTADHGPARLQSHDFYASLADADVNHGLLGRAGSPGRERGVIDS